MKKSLLVLVVVTLWLALAAQSPPLVTPGRLERLSNFPSRFVDARNIDVWLPAGYDPSRRYRVLYMHDGQALFSAATSLSHRSWRVAETATRLRREGKLDHIIVVGIWNNGPNRFSEYFPEKALEHLAPDARQSFVDRTLAGTPRANRYLRFIVEELKPAIDRRYATLTDRDNTLIMGSSMGALISLYAISEYPQIFGAAACLSTHWLGGYGNDPTVPLALFNYLRDHTPDPSNHRIYMDHGTRGLDGNYSVYQQVVDSMMHARGYTDLNYQSRVFAGAGHNEGAWAGRLDIPLIFLAGRSAPRASSIVPWSTAASLLTLSRSVRIHSEVSLVTRIPDNPSR